MKHIKDYINQIGLEIKKLFTSRFMIIFMGLLILLSIAIPILGKIDFRSNDRYYYGGYETEVIVNGETLDQDSPLYWEIMELNNAKERISMAAATVNEDLALEFVDLQLGYLENMAVQITSQEDYRRDLCWEIRQHLETIFIIDNIDVEKEELTKVFETVGMFYKDPSMLDTDFYNLSEIDRMEKYQEAKDTVDLFNNIIVNNDHIAYLNYRITFYENSITQNEESIFQLEQDIIEKPSNEELYNNQIEDLRKQITNTKEISIPMTQYRIDNNIVPMNREDWREVALNDKESALYSISYDTILPQADYEEDEYLKREYKTYNDYKEVTEKRIKENTERLIKADRSLATLKPDMSYVNDGTRKKVTNFLWYSLAIAVFGAIIGGSLIAREFQDGTIRLLLIRPKKRAKIVLSKLFALLIVCLTLYAATAILNLLTNAIVYGFADLGYPNYTVSSGDNGIRFFAYIVPKMLACTTTIFFAVAIAYFLSIVTRNTALSVAIPIVCFVGSLILMQIIGYSDKYSWIVYTPLPYVNIPSILINNSNNMYSMYGGMYSGSSVEPNLAIGIPMLLVLGVLAIGFGTWVFKKRDITN